MASEAKTTLPKTPAHARPQDATTMLRADHRKVSALFGQYENARSTASKQDIVEQVCTALTVHAQLEEEISYPAVKAAMKDHELVPEATVEHATVKDLIVQLRDGTPGDEMYDAKVKVLSEYVKHHVKEEHSEMFPKAKATTVDMRALGARMAARKSELLAELG